MLRALSNCKDDEMNKFYIFSLMILLTACYDDYDNSRVEVVEDKPTTIISTRINGKINNIENYDSEKLSLEFDDQFFELQGVTFLIELDQIAKTGEFLKLKSEGKTIGVKQSILIENDINYIEINAFQNNQTKSIDANLHSEGVLFDNLFFSYEGKAFDKNGDLFAGQFNIHTSLIEHPDGLQNLAQLAYDSKGEQLLLKDIKYAYWIESLTENGEPLFLNPAKNTINFGELSQDLRLFKLVNGRILKEIDDLTSTLSFDGSGLYIFAKVEPGVLMEGILEFQNARVSYSRLNYNQKHTYSSALGRWIGVFEKGVDATMSLGKKCGQSSSSWTVFSGEVNSKSNLLSIDDNEQGMLLLDAKIVNCLGQDDEVAALVIEQMGEERLFIYPSGKIEGYTSVCPGNVRMKSFNLVDHTIVNDLDWNTNNGSEIRYLTSCSSLADNFSLIELNGERMVYDSFEWYSENGETKLVDSKGRFEIKFDGSNLGHHPNEQVNIFIKDEGFGDKGYSISCINSSLGCGIYDFELSHFETTKGWVRVEFEGKIWAQTINPPIAGNYAIEGVIMIKTN